MQLFGQKLPIRGQPPKIGGNVASMGQENQDNEEEGEEDNHTVMVRKIRIKRRKVRRTTTHHSGRWYWSGWPPRWPGVFPVPGGPYRIT